MNAVPPNADPPGTDPPVVCRSPSQPRQGIPRATIAHNVGGGTGASGWISALLAGVSVFHGEAFTAQALTTSKAAAAAARGQIAGREPTKNRHSTHTRKQGPRDVGQTQSVPAGRLRRRKA
ncbi:hypothetical protein HPB48_020078 [Haemaphysalis longicornis]|uniref:Uncharacterized protein n=1 Tax=Haemaphysalis longicornis TaxID=44386 RepID=A0A9J6FXR1_HAELO|nr:hypothetical protein HPB48_020078 [Haemaphysalis longicornis]